MSGGHFDYAQYSLDTIIEDVSESIGEHDYIEKEIDNDLRKVVHYLSLVRIILHRADWYLSGDDGYETYKERLKTDLEEYMRNSELAKCQTQTKGETNGKGY